METKKIALIGNPNVGKTSLFNLLTGLRQKVGNYPGITVEKKVGFLTHQNQKFEIIDLPGTYGIFPNSLDEEITTQILLDSDHRNHPDLAVVISTPETLKRGLLLFDQVKDLQIPVIFVVNMIDESQQLGIEIHLENLKNYTQTQVIFTDAHHQKGIDQLIESLHLNPKSSNSLFPIPLEFKSKIEEIKTSLSLENEYVAWQYLAQKKIQHISNQTQDKINELRTNSKLIYRRLQVKETVNRYATIDEALAQITTHKPKIQKSFTEKLDQILIHPILGYVIFFGLLLLIFQAIFAWSGPFMDFIEEMFAQGVSITSNVLPEGPLNSLLTDGVLAGLGGIVIFVPQIVILFLFISIMEETGYMSRVVFLMDRWLKPFGLSGKSAVPLISGAACAIPAVMSARNIEHDKERLITMLVTPFMTCSARLPIYIVIIGLVIPDDDFLGFNLQGIALFALYFLGILAALGSAWVLKKLIKSNFKSYLILEMPNYKMPQWRNIGLTVWDKTSGFLFGAGKIILALSIVLWVLGNFGFSSKFYDAENIISAQNPNLTEEELANEVSSYKLENSILGNIGHVLEPAIAPLGYDWKMGIGLISSFAAREVFVGTMATVYSLGETDDENTIRQRMAQEVSPATGKPTYNLASGISLLLFYAFAMQCMSTIAIVKRETDSWKWTLTQVAFMSGLAYFAALIAYQLLK